MPHKRIVSEMARVDSPYKKITSSYDSLGKRRLHASTFHRFSPLVSELIPYAANLSPSALRGFDYSPEKKDAHTEVLELAGGITVIRKNAYAANSLLPRVEQEFEEGVRKIDFGKLEKREKWYRIFHNAVVNPIRVSAYIAIIGMVSSPVIAPLALSYSQSSASPGPETLVFPALVYSIAALSFSSLMNYFVNPAVKDLRKEIENMREGISELSAGLQGLLETTSFFRRN